MGDDPRARRELVREWLLTCARHPGAADRGWQELGVALLECGREFGVVRMDPDLVWAAAGTRRMADVDRELGRVLGGPVLMSLYPHRYYALVPVETGQRDEWAIERWEDARYLGEGSVIGAPLIGRTSPDGARPYWCVPVEEPGSLCDPEALSRFLTLGRTRLQQQREGR